MHPCINSIIRTKVFSSLVVTGMLTSLILLKRAFRKLAGHGQLIALLLLFFAALASCRKDADKTPYHPPVEVPDPLPIPNFNLFTRIITADSISVSWVKPVDPNGLPVMFDIQLNSQVIAKDVKDAECNLGKLNAGTSYYLIVTAKDSLGQSTQSRLNFATLQDKGAELIHKVILCQGRQREYGYYLPAGIAYNAPVPLVIYLHGAGGLAWSGLIGSQFKEICEKEKFIFVMPQALKGTTPDGTYIQWNAHEILAWDDAFFINTIIDTLVNSYGIDTHRIYVCGMSNGGFMTFYIAGRTNRFAAIAPMSGLMSYNIYNKYQTQWPLPLLYIHGTNDPIVPYNGNPWMPSVDKILNFWVRNNGCDTLPMITELPDKYPGDGSTVTLFNYNGADPRSEIRFYRINGGGHSVPGYETGANMDIKAFEVIWDFFKTKVKP